MTKVELLDGATVLVTLTQPAYAVERTYLVDNSATPIVYQETTWRWTWNGAAVGSHALTARLTDDRGGISLANGGTPWTLTVAAANQHPQVSLTAPADGAVIGQAPASMTLTATASDSDGSIARVDFYANSQLLGSATGTPYSFVWSNAAAGSYDLLAVATDNRGGAWASAVNRVRIGGTPPLVVLTSPIARSTVSAGSTVTLQADAVAPEGAITQVAFYDGTTLLGTATAAPYSYAWSGATNGTHVLTARATDSLGNSTTSTRVLLGVGTAPTTPPTVSITSPANNTTVAAGTVVTFDTASNDCDGYVANMKLYANGRLMDDRRFTPFATALNLGAGTYSLVARATDNAGASTDSAPVTLTVLPPPGNTPPQVALVKPLAGGALGMSSEMPLVATASDADGIREVEFYVDGVYAASGNPVSGNIFGTTVWGPTPGTHTVVARAIDNAGNSAQTAPVSFTVTSSNLPPSVSITSPVANQQITMAATSK